MMMIFKKKKSTTEIKLNQKDKILLYISVILNNRNQLHQKRSPYIQLKYLNQSIKCISSFLSTKKKCSISGLNQNAALSWLLTWSKLLPSIMIKKSLRSVFRRQDKLLKTYSTWKFPTLGIDISFITPHTSIQVNFCNNLVAKKEKIFFTKFDS